MYEREILECRFFEILDLKKPISPFLEQFGFPVSIFGNSKNLVVFFTHIFPSEICFDQDFEGPVFGFRRSRFLGWRIFWIPEFPDSWIRDFWSHDTRILDFGYLGILGWLDPRFFGNAETWFCRSGEILRGSRFLALGGHFRTCAPIGSLIHIFGIAPARYLGSGKWHGFWPPKHKEL